MEHWEVVLAVPEKKPSLAETHPEIAIQAWGWDPSLVSAGSNSKQEWCCRTGHRWITSIAHRTGKNPTGCPSCLGKIIIVGKNDLATTYPSIAQQADGWDPKTVLAGSNKKVQWSCKSGHKWNATISSRTGQKVGCPFCSNKKVLQGFNDLATTHPEVAIEADGWDPRTVVAGSAKKMKWKCRLGHSFSNGILHRTRRHQGCPTCSNRRLLVGFNDLATTHPHIAAEAEGWDPRTKMAGFGSDGKGKLLWRCPNGHTYRATPANRTNPLILSGCPYCAGNRNLQGFNDLATTHPQLAKEADGWEPRTIRGSTKKKLSWTCSIGHSYLAFLSERKAGAGCPFCSGHKVLVGFNDLATTHPHIAREANGWDVTTISAASQSRRKWKCSEGHTWVTSVGNRKQGKGCPTCANAGFDPNSKGWLYFLNHTKWELLQIGITNHPKDRLKSHSKLGWELIEIRGPMDGLLVQNWETAILRYIKAKGGKFANKIGIEPFDGYSESWLKESFTFESFKEIMSLIDECKE